MTRLPTHGEGTTRRFHQVILLGVPPRTYPAIDLSVIEAMRGRAPVSVLEEDLGGGIYVWAGDGSGLRAWIPFWEAASPARHAAAAMAWLADNGVEARFLGRASEPYPDLPPNCEPVRIIIPPKAAEASPPARPNQPAPPAQLDLFG